jgi:hypothetical protein
MSDQKEMKLVAAGEPAMEKLFEAFDEHQVFEEVDLKNLEVAIKKVELDLKNIRRALKGFRKTSKPEVLKG